MEKTLTLQFRTAGDAVKAQQVIDDRLALSPAVEEVNSTIEESHVGFAETLAVIGVTVAIVKGGTGLVKSLRDLIKEIEGLLKDLKGLKDAVFVLGDKAIPVNEAKAETIAEWIEGHRDKKIDDPSIATSR